MENKKYRNFIDFKIDKKNNLNFLIKDSKGKEIYRTNLSDGLKINNYIYTFLEKLNINIITNILCLEYSLLNEKERREKIDNKENKKLLYLYANKSNIKIYKIILSTLKIDNYKNISTFTLELWLGINILSNECFFIKVYNINRINSFKENKILKEIEEKYYKSLNNIELWI